MYLKEDNILTVDNLTGKIQMIIQKEATRDEKLLEICILLHDSIAKFDWVGFYLVDPDADRELVLGPYVGNETRHIRIPFGTGICGQAAEKRETLVVNDVKAEENYLSCRDDVQSEIIIPIIKDNQLLGELDIDSHKKAALSEKDIKMLETICRQIAVLF